MTNTKSRGKGKPCARCGILRKPQRTTSVLCTDCRYVLTEAERQMWTQGKVAA